MPLIAEIITIRQMKAILKTMKRLIICLVLVAGICFGGFAEENDSAENTYRFTNGGFWSCGQDFSGGFGEFGINLLRNEKILVLRNCIYCMGSGGKLTESGLDTGGFEVGDRFIIGGRTDNNGFTFRSYGYFGGGVQFYRCQNHNLFDAPIIALNFGGGFEFQYCKNCAFVIEFGGVNRFLTGDYKNTFTDFSRSSPALTIGFRTF